MLPPPPPLHFSGEVPPPAPPPLVYPGLSAASTRRRRRGAPSTLVGLLGAAAVLVGVLLGGRISAEDGLTAARDELAAGNAGRAVSLDEAIAGRSGLLMIFDPGASGSAAHDAQVARIAWARQLSARGDVDGAIAAIAQVSLPSLIGTAATVRTEILLAAAAAAVKGGHPSVALQRLDQAKADAPPDALVAQINAMRAADEVPAAAQLMSAGQAVDALALLDDASSHGAAAAAAPLVPAALLAAAQSQLAAFAYPAAVANLNRLISTSPRSSGARTARSLLQKPQSVTGTLVDGTGHPAAGRVRLGSHYTVLNGGYSTSGPFYYGTADAAGDFTVIAVPVGGPYVLEYYRNGGWMTLVDPRTDQPANPVTVAPLTPVDLTFIVLPA